MTEETVYKYKNESNSHLRPFMASESVDEIFTALSLVQGELTTVIANQENDFFNSYYADLAALLEAMRKPLLDQNLALFQTTKDTQEGFVTVITTLGHSSGQWIAGEMTLKPEKTTPQGFGSAITYMRRYGATAIVGLAQQDDDGKGATRKKDEYERLKPKQLDTILSLADNYWGSKSDEILERMNKLVFGVDATKDIPSANYEQAITKLTNQAKREGLTTKGDAEEL